MLQAPRWKLIKLLGRSIEFVTKQLGNPKINEGLKARALLKDIFLSQKYRKASLKFVNNYEHFNVDGWMKVTWYESQHMFTMKFGGGSLKAFGCFVAMS